MSNSTRTRRTSRRPARHTGTDRTTEVTALKAQLDEQVTALTSSDAWRAMLRAAVGLSR